MCASYMWAYDSLFDAHAHFFLLSAALPNAGPFFRRIYFRARTNKWSHSYRFSYGKYSWNKNYGFKPFADTPFNLINYFLFFSFLLCWHWERFTWIWRLLCSFIYASTTFLHAAKFYAEYLFTLIKITK